MLLFGIFVICCSLERSFYLEKHQNEIDNVLKTNPLVQTKRVKLGLICYCHQPVTLSVSSQAGFELVYSSDGRVVRASASIAVNLGFIPSRVKPITLKSVFTASLLDAQH